MLDGNSNRRISIVGGEYKTKGGPDELTINLLIDYMHFMPTARLATLETTLTLTQVCRLLEKLGVSSTRSLVNYYSTRIGTFEPLVTAQRNGKGRGRGKNMRLYSVADVVLLRWLFQLAGQGLAVRKFYNAIVWLRKHLPEALDDPEVIFFLTDNNEVGVSCRQNKPIQLTGFPGQILLTLAASSVTEVLDETSHVLSA
jgi:hypothetical protein